MNELLVSIHGIGTKTAKSFQKHKLKHVSDLTLHSADALHDIVDRLASRDEVLSWQRVALLAQVSGLDVGSAEALFRTGITNISELSRQSLSGLRKKFKAAKDEGLVDEVPSADQCCAIIQDATVLDHTGSLTGRVVDRRRRAVGGATVIAGAVSTTTDELGYFRLVRLPFSAPPSLVFKHKKFETLIVEEPVMAQANETIVTEEYAFERAARRRRASAALSELDGDVLPSINAYRMRTKNGGFDDIEEGDILIVSEFYKSSPDAKIVSRFKVFEDGEFFVRVFKVPVKRLPRNAQLRDQLQFENGKLRSVDLGEEEFLRILLTKRAIRELSGDEAAPKEYGALDLFGKRFELEEAYGLNSGYGG
jgi:hypothetical protein